MNTKMKLSLASLVLLGSVSLAHANDCMSASANGVDLRDVVRDTRGAPVRSSNGNCVRSKWLNSYDACTQAAPAPVAIPAITREDRTVYFAFGKSSLTKEAKQRLTNLAVELKARGAAIKSVRIAGYADRIGKAAANEKLSKKRADAVRKFLMSQGVAQANVVETRWFGDSVAAAKCPKNLKHADKIICLQPDRRVEVEIDYDTTVAPQALTK